MSFDENQHLDKDEVDLAELFRSVWSYKFSLLVFIVLSVPITIIYSTTIQPTYRAETVFEKPSKENTQSNTSLLKGSEGLGFMSLLSAGFGGASDSFLSEIRSESFLKTVIINNPEINNQMIQRHCPLPSEEIPRFSVRALLIALGISENRAPSESQKESLLVKCVNEMLEIEFDSYGSSKSSAYKLFIESGEPNFSANLANQIVEKYFVRHEKLMAQDFQNVKKYLSKVITEAQLEFTEANKLMQNFKIKHTLLMNLQPLSSLNSSMTIFGDDGISIPASPFASELNKGIANLSQLEKSLSQVKQARLNLLSLKEEDPKKIKAFIESIEAQSMLSRAFVTAISKINNFSANTKEISQEIKTIVSRELIILKQQTQALAEKIGKREEQTMHLMNIENRFQDLAIDVAKKQLIFEGLKDQLKQKILTTGLANTKQPVLLTKAVPPFVQASPNKILILTIGIVISLFVGIAYILIRQISVREVHSLSQLQRISRFLNCHRIKHKQLKQMAEKPDETVIGQAFFSHARGIGKFGCIIDLSQKINTNSLASDFFRAIVGLFATDNSKILCLDTSPIKKSFSAGAQNNFASNRNDQNLKGILSKSTLTFNDEEGMISAGEVNEIKNKYSEYDKIVCVMGSEIGDLTKFKFIEQCDFYILIGRSFHFDEYTYKKFSNTVWEKENKCLGFFLID